MISFKDIEEANKGLSTQDIKGKQYVMVNQRIKAFRKLFPMGRIDTRIVEKNGDSVLMEAIAYDDEGKPLANGFAEEFKNGNYINKTSYIENCQTSAIGRALGQLALGVDSSMASFEEVTNAINNQSKTNTRSTAKRAKEPQAQKKMPSREDNIKFIQNACIKHSICATYVKGVLEQKHVTVVDDLDDKTIYEMCCGISNSIKTMEGMNNGK